MLSTQTLIIGAGVTGLAVAKRLIGHEFLICEAQDQIGGYCKTICQDGFVWDYSGHFFHFRHPEIEKELVNAIGEDNIRRVIRKAQIYGGDRWIDYPFQRNIHQLPLDKFLDCLVDLVERDFPNPKNFEEMLYAKFGRGIAEHFLLPYNRKLYATELKNLDIEAMGRFFPYANTKEIISGFRNKNDQTYSSEFTYPIGGAMEYVWAIANGIRNEQFLLNNAVLNIDLKNKTATTSNTTIRYERLVSTIPFPRLLSLSGVDYEPQVYSWNKVLVFNLGFDRKGFEGLHWAYFPQSELIFYRVGFYDNILKSSRMSLYVEIGLANHVLVNKTYIESARHRVLEDLMRCGIVTGHRLVSEHHIVLDPAYVHICQASKQDVEEKKIRLRGFDAYSIGRYGSWTYCSIEDNIVEARKLVDEWRTDN